MSSFFLALGLLLDYSNQGHLTKFSTNLMKKTVNVYSSFPTNNPCNQAVHLKDNRFLVILDNFLENHCNFNDFYLLNLWKNLLGGLGLSSRTVNIPVCLNRVVDRSDLMHFKC